MQKRRRKDDFYDFTSYKKGGQKRMNNEESDGDVGIVYYRSAQGLRSPRGYELNKAEKLITKDKITLKEGSLFNMCLKFIAINIDLLDSLLGLPEIIGEQIFAYTIKENVFEFEINATGYWTCSDRVKLKKLALFDEAFNEQLLKNLSLVKIGENFDFMPLLSCFSNLSELDLSGRSLPDELLTSIPKLSCLEKLVLQNTSLSDKCISKLTLPYRVYKDSPQELEILDISSNHDITNLSIELLLTLWKLRTLNLTGTSVSMHYALVYELKQFRWQISRDKAQYPIVKTIGWAAPVISLLEGKDKSKSSASTKAASFYSSRKKLKTAEVPSNNDTNLILLRSSFNTCSLKFNRAVLVDSGQMKASVSIGQSLKVNSLKKIMNNTPPFTKTSQNFVSGNCTFAGEAVEGEDIFKQYSSGSSISSLPVKKTLFECFDNF